MTNTERPGDGGLQEKIETWIERTGYGLEMRVARAVADAGLSVLQSEGYQDPNTSKHREIDVLAYHPERFGGSKPGLLIPMECKRSPGRPWVLFSGSWPYSPESQIKAMPATPKGKALVSKLSRDGDALGLGLFNTPALVGYSLVSANLGKPKARRNRAYDAVRSVISAAYGLLDEFSGSMVAFAWPVLVVEGKLFQASLDEDAGTKVAEISRGLLVWRRPSNQHFLTIVTEDGLKGLLETLQDDCKRFTLFASEV